MASLSYDSKNDRFLVQFQAMDGTRKSLTIKATRGRDKGQSKAAAVKNHIEELSTARKTGTSIPPVVAHWIESLPEATYAQLVDAGLLMTRQTIETRLEPFLDDWFDERSDHKKSTLQAWGNARRNLLTFFGGDKDIRDMTEEHAERFERWLKTDQKLSESTIRKRCGFAKQMLSAAVKARLIDRNPLQDLKVGAIGNKKRQYFVSEEESQKVLTACPDAEWRACFSLARYGGLRIPSEIQALTWDDIDWEHNRFRVHAPKTEHHSDNGDRLVPLFPEVRAALNELWDQAPDGIYVLPRLRSISNLNPQLGRIIRRAGLKEWPKRWQNLRATRATELERQFPSHVVTGWCGHTERIAEQHYWMTTESDFARAAQLTSDAHMMQHGAESSGKWSQTPNGTKTKSPEKPGSAKSCTVVRKTPVEDNGLEPMTFWLPARRSPN